MRRVYARFEQTFDNPEGWNPAAIGVIPDRSGYTPADRVVP
jgi:hypothetical protein